MRPVFVPSVALPFNEPALVSDEPSIVDPVVALLFAGVFPNGTAGLPYDETIAVSGGSGVYTVTGYSGLPPGIDPPEIIGTNLRVFGFPEEEGTSHMSITVEDDGDVSGVCERTIVVHLPAVTTYLEDTFTEASPPVAIASHTMDSGGSWTSIAPCFFRCVAGGKLEDQFGSLGCVISNAGVSDGVVRFTIDQASGSGIIFRSNADRTVFLRASINAANSIEFFDDSGDSLAANNGGVVPFTISFPATVKLTLAGSLLTLTIEGNPDATLVYTTAYAASNTYFGPRLGVADGTGDNFSVKSE